MQSRYQSSDELFEEAKNFLPGGVQSSRHPNMFVAGEYPIFMKKAQGSHVWDVDGNEYIDWLMSYGPIILGYCYPCVDEAVKDQIGKGFLINLAQPLQNRLAKKLTSIIPCAELVMFCNSGSDATSIALRLARVYTKKDIVFRCGYHGWHDWAVGGVGVPKAVAQSVFAFEYNNIDSLKDLFHEHKNKVACVIMMPYEVDLPEGGFLQEVKDITHENGILFIFDEIRSGFRTSLGGAQEYFGVTPDMATFSKALANGYPIGAVVGRREVMQAVYETHISGTFFPNTLGMAGALSTIHELERTDAVKHFWKIGRMLMEGLKEVARSAPVTAEVMGIPPMPYLMFGPRKDYGKVWRSDAGLTPSDPKAWQFSRDFYGEMARRAVFLHPHHHWFTCLSHTADDVQQTVDTALEVVAILRHRG